MLRVYKHTIPVKDYFIEDYFTLNLPAGTEILTVQTQHDKPQIWVLVDPGQQSIIPYNFRVAGTGHDIREDRNNLNYIGTFQLAGGNFVFHLFWIIEE